MENKTTGIVSLLGENSECAVVQNDNIEVETGKKEKKTKERTTRSRAKESHTRRFGCVLEDEWRGTCPRLVVFFWWRGQHERKWGRKKLEKYKTGTGWISHDAFETIKLFLHQHGRLAPFRGRRWCARPALLLDCVEVVFPAFCYVRLYVVTDWLLCQQTETLFQTLKSESTHTHSTCRHATNSKNVFLLFLQNASLVVRFFFCVCSRAHGLASSTTNGPVWCSPPPGSVSLLVSFKKAYTQERERDTVFRFLVHPLVAVCNQLVRLGRSHF